jgi:dihydropteroate synthase
LSGGQPGSLVNRPRIMGVVNVTPDSFSDGGAYLDAATLTSSTSVARPRTRRPRR